MNTEITGIIVVDLQPAYASTGNGSSISCTLMYDVLDYLRALPAHTQITAMYVNEELSGDTFPDVYEFWQSYGADEELMTRIQWVEKSYAYLRGWMDNGINSDEISAVLRHMRKEKCWDSRQLDNEVLEALSEDGEVLLDPLFRDHAVEGAMEQMRALGGTWQTCGGGQNECLLEVELVLESGDVPFERISHLTY